MAVLLAILTHVTRKALASYRGGGDASRLSQLDFGILQVAILVAALDGAILDDEIAAYRTLARTCRGFTEANAAACLDTALRRAGYLMAIARIDGYTTEQRLQAFADAALEVLPRGFADGNVSDLRRAFVLWIAMGLSDGDFSAVERSAIDLLQDRLARVMKTPTDMDERRWGILSPAHCLAEETAGPVRKITLFEPDFVDRAVTLVRSSKTAPDISAAEAALFDFINQ